MHTKTKAQVLGKTKKRRLCPVPAQDKPRQAQLRACGIADIQNAIGFGPVFRIRCISPVGMVTVVRTFGCSELPFQVMEEIIDRKLVSAAHAAIVDPFA
jgi:hypothetical protein